MCLINPNTSSTTHSPANSALQCRQDDWVLKEQAGVSAEVNEIWEYKHRTSRQHIEGDLDHGPHPDIDEQYYDAEKKTRRITQFHRLFHNHQEYHEGYPSIVEPLIDGYFLTTYSGPDGRERTTEVEMSNIRQFRRINNKRRRDAVEAAGEGILDLDPVDPNPDGIAAPAGRPSQEIPVNTRGDLNAVPLTAEELRQIQGIPQDDVGYILSASDDEA